MQSFSFTVLGANSAVPLPNRFSSSFVVSYGGRHIMIDCGEGAQIKMNEYGIKPSKLDTILISHMHGDHIFGLPGLLNSLALNGRSEALHIYGPVGLSEYISTVRRLSGSYDVYEVIVHELTHSEYEHVGNSLGLEIAAFTLSHRVPTYGYRLTEPDTDNNINPESIARYSLTVPEIRQAKEGGEVIRDGKTLRTEDIMMPIRKGRSMAYCSDTVYLPEIVPHVADVDLLYHEATYMQDRAHKAQEHMHSTTIEAGTIAKDAQVKELLIGHYSSRYEDFSEYLAEAQTVFSATKVAISGDVHPIGSQ